MQRIRSIKPDAFKHDGLYDLEKETGLPIRWAFAGLWSVSDKRGRFEWRPRAIKADVLPYDDVDFSRVLEALAARGFVSKYSIEGKDYGWIPGFQRHQVINNRETESCLPPHPDDPDKTTTWKISPRVGHASVTRHTRDLWEGKGREGKEGEGASPSDDPDPMAESAEGWFFRSYPVWYAEERHGAKYVPREVLDFAAVHELVQTWPDRAYLERMARTYLRSTKLGQFHNNRSIAGFRSEAPGIDSFLRAEGAA